MKKVILISALPGAGKTFLANKLYKKAIEDGFTCEIFTTDDFFMVDNEYRWNGGFISAAHEYNFGRFAKAMLQEIDILIVPNTNLNAWTMYKYVELAVKNEYEYEIVQPKTKWANDPMECSKRNSHNVPLSTIQRMHDKRESIKDMEAELRRKFKS